MMINTRDRLPSYGKPVLIKVRGFLQDVIYKLCGADNVPDWNAPDWFEVYNDSNYRIRWDKVESWIYLDDVAKLLEGK